MNNFIKENLLFVKATTAIILLFVVLFLTSMLLEVSFVNKLVIRQIFVYMLMVIEIFAVVRYVMIINK